MAPPHPHLDGHRHIDRLDARLDQFGREFRHPHQRGSRIAIGHFPNRTAHVDIDDRRPAIGIQLRRLPHFIGGTADQLHRHRFLDRIPRRLLHRLPRLPDRSLAGDHLGDVEPRPIAPHQPPKRQVRHTRHRREDHRIVDGHRTDLDRFKGYHGCLKNRHERLQRQWAGCKLQVPLGILLQMQDTHNVQHAAIVPEIDHV